MLDLALLSTIREAANALHWAADTCQDLRRREELRQKAQALVSAGFDVELLIGACTRATCQCQRAALGIHQHDCHLGAIPAVLAGIGASNG